MVAAREPSVSTRGRRRWGPPDRYESGSWPRWCPETGCQTPDLTASTDRCATLATFATGPGATLGRDGPPRHRAARLPRRARRRGRRARAAGERLGRAARVVRASTGTLARGGHALRGRRSQLLPALHAVQDRIGWISQPALNYISRRLAVPPAEAYGVATFYALYATKPQPPVVAHVCDDIACRIAGAEGICDDLRRAVGPEGEAARDGHDRLEALAVPGPVRPGAGGDGHVGRRDDPRG